MQASDYQSQTTGVKSYLTPVVFYALCYFFLFSYIAIIQGLLPLYFQTRDISNSSYSIISLLGIVTWVFGGPVTQNLAHRYFSVRSLMLAAGICYAISIAGLSISSAPSLLGLFFAISMFSFAAAVSLIDTETLHSDKTVPYEKIRLWGSLGFIVTAFGTGMSAGQLGATIATQLGMLIPAVCFLILVYQNRALFPDLARYKFMPTQRQHWAWRALPQQYFLILAIVFLNWVSHQTLYIYLSIHLSDLGWSARGITQAWMLGVCSELVMFLLLPKIFQHVSFRACIILSMLITCIRWTAFSLSTDTNIILLLQVLHAFTFSMFYISSVKLSYRILPPEFRDRGQGYLTAAGSGAGSVVARLLLAVWTIYHPDNLHVQFLFFISAVVAVIGSCMALALREHLPN